MYQGIITLLISTVLFWGCSESQLSPVELIGSSATISNVSTQTSSSSNTFSSISYQSSSSSESSIQSSTISSESVQSNISSEVTTESSMMESSSEESMVSSEEPTVVSIDIPSDFDWTTIPDSLAHNSWNILYNFDLNDASITLPVNVTLVFNGGSLNNYTSISGSNTQIDAGFVGSFDGSGVLLGTWDLQEVFPEWFGAIGDGTTFDSESFNNALTFLNVMDGGDLILTAGKDYVIEQEVFLFSNIHIIGNGANISVPTYIYEVSPNRSFAIFTTIPIPSRPMSKLHLSSGSIQFSNIQIKEITFNMNRDGNTMALGWMLSSDFNAIRLVDTQDGLVENCTFLDKQTAEINILVAVVNFDNTFNTIARNNTFDRVGAIRTNDGSGNIIDGNYITNSPGTSIEIYLGSHHQVINNEMNDQWVDASSLGSSANYAIIKNNKINVSNSSAITIGHPNVEGEPPYGADYVLVEGNYIKGGPVTVDPVTGNILTGGMGIIVPNGVGARIINNEIEGLYKADGYCKNCGGIVIGGGMTDQSRFDDLFIDGNTITDATIGIQIKDMINATVSNNSIERVYSGIFGLVDSASSPNSFLTIDGNTIINSEIALSLKSPYNLITNNVIAATDTVGFLDYGRYTFSNNTITEGLVGPRFLEPISVTMKDNYFYNTNPILDPADGNLGTGSIATLRAPEMDISNLTIEGTVIDFPESGTPTTWVLRAYQLKDHVGSQYFNSTAAP